MSNRYVFSEAQNLTLVNTFGDTVHELKTNDYIEFWDKAPNNISRITFRSHNFSNTTNFDFKHMDDGLFEECTFTDLDIDYLNSNGTVYIDCSFRDCIFTNVSFYNAKFYNCKFSNCTFQQANLNNTLFYNTTFKESIFEYCDSYNLIFEKCLINETALEEFIMRHGRIIKSILIDVRLYKVKILNSSIYDCDFKAMTNNYFATTLFENTTMRNCISEHEVDFFQLMPNK